MKKFILSAICCIALVACSEDSDTDQLETDRKIIEQYLKDNNLTATAHPSGLYYSITEPGTGGSPSTSSRVIVRYKGYLTDGTIFDETTGNQTRAFQLSSLIPAWQIGIPLLKKGGKGKFFVPSGLGYGSSATDDIPANSVLIFEIELVDYL